MRKKVYISSHLFGTTVGFRHGEAPLWVEVALKVLERIINNTGDNTGGHHHGNIKVLESKRTRRTLRVR